MAGQDWNPGWLDSKFDTLDTLVCPTQSCVVAEDHVLWDPTNCAPLGHLSSLSLSFPPVEWVEHHPTSRSAPRMRGPVEYLAFRDSAPPQPGGFGQIPNPL